ncbi:RnfH family protein [Chromobacterium sp. ATCC 53434]|uniref:RnfH family protein n=1 Tax=Chromobacterium sp. (strain ATCC 53434 / SC 14030) TaxID=2059672 RepID=UPI000C76193F|nr:RnfH family protein [Chromobacterium sp. ATCC 53434]AUH50086.1 RnfH family protein [Chromobacterium sp. ATCC 53434]
MTERLSVEVAYARPERQWLVALSLPSGACALDAVRASGILAQCPELDEAALKLGVFGKAVKPEAALREHDRVEIYRPLLADPKEVRRQRAEAGKRTKKGG